MELALVFFVGLVTADVVRILASHQRERGDREPLSLRPLPRRGGLA